MKTRKKVNKERKSQEAAVNLRTFVENMEPRVLFSTFTPGDLVVYRVGTGGTTLGSGATAVSIDEYTTSSGQTTPQLSVAMPTAVSGSNNPLTSSGSATSEGNLTLSQNGQTLLVPGFDAIPGVASVATTNASTSGSVTGVTLATGTNAITISTTSTVGMANAQSITISGVGGISAANGTFYLKTSGSTGFALYSNSALTTPVTGSGTYTSGTGTWTDASLTSVTPREVGVVSASGTVNTTTTLGGALSGGDIRGAASVDGVNGVYASGVTGNVYSTIGATTTATSLNTQNSRSIEIINNQLYISTGSTGLYLDTVGSGLPTTAQAPTSLSIPSGAAGTGLGGPYAFAFATLGTGSAPDTLYVADNYNYALEKFSLENGAWVASGYVGGTSSGPLNGITGVVVEPMQGGEQVFVSTPSKIYSITDTSGFGGTLPTTATLTTVATAATNEAFRGISFAPQSSLSVTSAPVSTTGVTNGPASFFAAINPGTNATIQWQVNTNDGTGFNNLNNGTDANGVVVSGATTNTLTLSGLSLAENGYEYQAVFTSGALSVTTPSPTAPAVLTVTNHPYVTSVVPATGQGPAGGPTGGGTSVVVTGYNLSDASSIAFGSNPATTTFSAPVNNGDGTYSITVSSTAATVSGLGTVDVQVTSPEGTSAPDSTDKFTYATSPTVTGVLPTSGSHLGATSVVITGTNFYNVTGVSFGVGNPATSFTVNAAGTQITAVSPAHANGVVDVTVTGASGTSATGSADQFTFTTTTVAQAEALTTGTAVTLDNNPVITSVLSVGGSTLDTISYTSWAFLVNDGTGSIEVYSKLPTGSTYTPTVGDTISISGTYSPFQQIPELGTVTAISLISSNPSYVPPVQTDTLSQASTLNSGKLPLTIGGYLVTIPDVYLSGFTSFAATNVTGTLTDTSSPADTMPVEYYVTSYSLPNTNLYNHAIPTSLQTVTGLVAVPSSTAQLDVMSISDAAPIVSGVSPANGPTTGGNTITINGYGFTSATEVDFVSAFNANGTEKTFVSATPTVISDNQMTVSAPAGALGTVDLIVTNDAGMSSQTANDHYTYSVSPAVAGVSPVGGPTAGNTTVTITGTNFAGLTAVNFGPNAAKSFHLVTNGDGSPYVDGAGYNEITAVTPASTLSGNGTGPVDVTVVANHITSGVNPPGDRFNYEITPSVTGISPKTGPDRGGTSVIITGTGFTSTSTVNFVDGSGNSTPATSVTFNSATQMTAVTPALALGTVVDVEVTNDIATSSASSLDKYTYGPTTIAVAETLTPSSSVTLDSTNLVVTAILSTNAFLVNDNTGSASIYGTLPATYTLPNGNTSTSSYVPTIGDKLSVTGTWSPYNQIPELAPTAVTLVSQGNPVATPLTETIPAVNLATLPFNIAGYMVTLRNVTIAGEGTAGSNFGTGNSPAGATITDGSNNTMTLYYWPTSYSVASTNFSNQAIPAGPVDLTGLVDVYSTSGQAEFLPMAFAPTVTGVTPIYGPAAGGTSVAISGTHFTDAVDPTGANTIVNFINASGVSTPATFVKVNGDGSITATAPAGTATEDVVVTVQDGGSSQITAADHFTYAPTVTAVSPTSAAPGTSVTITGTGFTGTTAVNFNSTPAATGSIQVNAAGTQITVTVPAGSGTVDVTVKTPAGTSTTSAADQFTYGAAVTPPTLVGSPVINGDNPNGLYTAAGQPSNGVQRSMVEDVVYTFNEPVTITNANSAFTVLVANNSGGTVPGTLSAYEVANPTTGLMDGTSWAVSLTGNTTAGDGISPSALGSIANGEYTIQINPAYVFAAADGTTTMAAGTGRTDSFYCLFGDINGDEVVNGGDNLKLKAALASYNAAFDGNEDGFVNGGDNLIFKRDQSISYLNDGFTLTI